MAKMYSARSFAARGGVWVAAQSVLMVTVIMLAVMFPGDWTQIPVIVIGAGLVIIGGYFGIAGVVVLGKNRTPFPQPRAGSELVQHGIYARVRHPLYTSVILVLMGWAMIWQSVVAFMVALILIPLLRAKAGWEEHWLRGRFPSYSEYERRVPRFVPRLRTKPNLLCNF